MLLLPSTSPAAIFHMNLGQPVPIRNLLA